MFHMGTGIIELGFDWVSWWENQWLTKRSQASQMRTPQIELVTGLDFPLNIFKQQQQQRS